MTIIKLIMWFAKLVLSSVKVDPCPQVSPKTNLQVLVFERQNPRKFSTTALVC